MMRVGIKNVKTIIVSAENTAAALGSGELEVFATPALAALAEAACWQSVAGELKASQTSVGTSLTLRHLAATPLGGELRCESELIEADGRRLVFRIEVSDSAGLVGEGEHERFIVDKEKFLSKAEGRR
ncbi:MAG: hotdog domain-containing protein [Oscillospiraceae bacterium]|nr:hotdog domain-containing protein [Oscillospiraceae bacterium]